VTFQEGHLYNQLVNNDFKAFGRVIQIKGQEDQVEKRKRTEFLRFRKLFVGALNPSTTERELYQAFWEFGDILEVNIQLNNQSQSRCFGYVLFKYPYTLKQVLIYN
jgi:RNA recognition motif-containing protein